MCHRRISGKSGESFRIWGMQRTVDQEEKRVKKVMGKIRGKLSLNLG